MIRRKPFALAAVVALILLLTWSPPASAQVLGPEFLVNSYTTNGQYGAVVAADGAGRFVVIWESSNQDGSPRSVFGQRLDASGGKAGNEFPVNAYTTDYQAHPSVAADPAGNFVVVWDSSVDTGVSQDGSDYGVFGRRYDSSGSELGSEFQINSFTTNKQAFPAVSADASGSFVVVWESRFQASLLDIFGQRFDSAGGPVGSEFKVNTYSSGTQLYPAIATDAAGNFMVVWWSGNNDQDGDGFGIFGQRFDAAGDKVGSELQVNTYTTGSQFDPAIAADAAGNFVVVWTSDYQDGDAYGVFGQRFDSAGARQGSEFQVNTYTTSDQQHATVAAGSAGDFVVTWDNQYQDGDSFGVFGQRFEFNGTRVGSEFQVNGFTTSSQRHPGIAADGAGNYVVAWVDSGQDGAGTGIVGRRANVAIFADEFESSPLCTWSEETPPFSTCTCGNGALDPDETCDAAGESASCDIDCTPPVCGDGLLNTSAGEVCDDGNTLNGDGCSDSCLAETGRVDVT